MGVAIEIHNWHFAVLHARTRIPRFLIGSAWLSCLGGKKCGFANALEMAKR